MAFKTWQIGLHIQQHEALAIAVIRGASGWSLQRWWRLPLMNASTAEGTIPDPQSLAHVLRPWSRELPLRHRIYLSFPANRTLQRAFPHPPKANSTPGAPLPSANRRFRRTVIALRLRWV